jgi:hypothetical protein
MVVHLQREQQRYLLARSCTSAKLASQRSFYHLNLDHLFSASARPTDALRASSLRVEASESLSFINMQVTSRPV